MNCLGFIETFLCMIPADCFDGFSQALDSDGEEAAREGARGSKPKNSDPKSGLIKSAASEGSSDGELVEIPDQESDAVHKKKIDAAE